MGHDDNPWQTAAAQQQDSGNDTTNGQAQQAAWSERPPWLSSKTTTAATTAASSTSPTTTTTTAAHAGDSSNNNNNHNDESSWTSRVVQTWQVVDGIAGLLWLLYAMFLCRASHHHHHRHHAQQQAQSEQQFLLQSEGDRAFGAEVDDDDEQEWKITTTWHVIMTLSWSVAVVLLFRTVVGGLSMSLDWWDRCGLRWSANTSVVLGFTWMTVSLVGFFANQDCVQWLEQHYHTLLVSKEMWRVLQHQPVLLWILPLVACLLELLRWYMVQRYYFILQKLDNQIVIAAAQAPRRTRRPWWWQSNSHHPVVDTDNFTDPLIEVHPRSSDQHASSGGWFSSWGGWFGNADGGGRDDASVEYASLSEDWQSRTQEDPLWWSRDAEEMKTHK